MEPFSSVTQADKDLEQFVGLSKRVQIFSGIFGVLMMVLAVLMIYPVVTGTELLARFI